MKRFTCFIMLSLFVTAFTVGYASDGAKIKRADYGYSIPSDVHSPAVATVDANYAFVDNVTPLVYSYNGMDSFALASGTLKVPKRYCVGSVYYGEKATKQWDMVTNPALNKVYHRSVCHSS